MSERIKENLKELRKSATDAAPAIVRLAAAMHLIAPGLVEFGDCELDTLADAFEEIAASPPPQPGD